jgi:hypothetical protein
MSYYWNLQRSNALRAMAERRASLVEIQAAFPGTSLQGIRGKLTRMGLEVHSHGGNGGSVPSAECRITLSPPDVLALATAARARGVEPDVLCGIIMRLVIRDDLFTAVIDTNEVAA